LFRHLPQRTATAHTPGAGRSELGPTRAAPLSVSAEPTRRQHLRHQPEGAGEGAINTHTHTHTHLIHTNILPPICHKYIYMLLQVVDIELTCSYSSHIHSHEAVHTHTCTKRRTHARARPYTQRRHATQKKCKLMIALFPPSVKHTHTQYTY